MHKNLGFAVAVICTLSGVSILYSGMTTSDMSQVLGGATLLSVALVTAFLVVKSKMERSRTFR
jgi:Na+/alanine symporter